MRVSTLFTILIIFCINAYGKREYSKKAMLEGFYLCMQGENKSPQLLEHLKDSDLSKLTHNDKCVLKCFFDMFELIDKKTKQVDETLIERLSTPRGADPLSWIMKSCNNQAENCETAFEMYACYDKYNATIFFKDLEEYSQEQMLSYLVSCMSGSSKNKNKLLKHLQEGIYDLLRRPEKCAILCFLEKVGIFSRLTKQIDEDNVRKLTHLTNESEIQSAIKTCNHKQRNPCDTAMYIYKCLEKSNTVKFLKISK